MASPHRDDLIRALPYARRYARALTGSQARGDDLVAQSLRMMMTGAASNTDDDDPRLALYGAVTHRYNEQGSGKPGSTVGLTPTQRQLLLLTALEDVRVEDAAPLVDLTQDDAREQLNDARERLRTSAAADVLIIEDEPIIAMDIQELVTNCGHRVVGVAATEAEAVAIAAREQPGLILADINLGAGGDGTHAVADILKQIDAPVIFVTAYPERLLTGEEREPAFIIPKPFDPLTLAITTYQAVTGGVMLD